MAPDTPKHFVRDTTLASEVADQFGGGAGNAEQLVEANSLRFSEELSTAQLHTAESGLRPEDRREIDIDRKAVAKAADLDADDVLAYDVHGDSVVFAFQTADGRVHKDVLLIDSDDKLEAIEGKDSPARAALRAQVAATAKVREAQSEADEILAKAHAEADEIKAKAAAEAQQERVEKVEDAQKQATKDAEKRDEDARKAEAKRTATSKSSGK